MATYKSIAYAPISAGGSMVLLSSQTASSDSTLSFTSGINSNYKEYVFKFVNMHPSADEEFAFQCSTDGGSNYNTTVTSSSYYSINRENDSGSALAYYANADQAQGTAFEWLTDETDNANDSTAAGMLWLFDPSNTTFVKQYLSTCPTMNPSPYTLTLYKGGYFNTTSAINAIQFKFNSGDMDAGTIKMYGVN